MALKMSRFNLNAGITEFDYLYKEVIFKIQLNFNGHRKTHFNPKLSLDEAWNTVHSTNN